jgi:Tol biopolymer transport system component
VSSSGELAVGLVRPGSVTLARLPLDGGAPREVLDGVNWAAWSPDGRSLAVVRSAGGKQRLEFPIGTVLYETGGWITHPRVSPDGDSVAFLDHPVLSDDGGRVSVIEGGKRRDLSREFRSVWGLAWARAGREVWFTAAETGARSLWSIDLAGRERLLLATPGRLTLEDVARDGRALLTRDNVRVEMFGRPPGGAGERELSGLDWSLVRDISEDGARVLFNESGEGGGGSYGIYVRGTDGSPAVRLGEGSALALSPDGSRVLARQRAGASPLVLLPTGAGEVKVLAGPPLSVQRAAFLPDGRRLLLSGNAPGSLPRVWLQDALSGAPAPVTAEGVTGFWNGASPDGRTFLAKAPDGGLVAAALDGGAGQALKGIDKDDLPIRWSSDGRSLYVARLSALPGRVWRVDLATGSREPWLAISPADRAGVTSIQGLRLSADGRAYVYSYRRVQSDLYLVSGLE